MKLLFYFYEMFWHFQSCIVTWFFLLLWWWKEANCCRSYRWRNEKSSKRKRNSSDPEKFARLVENFYILYIKKYHLTLTVSLLLSKLFFLHFQERTLIAIHTAVEPRTPSTSTVGYPELTSYPKETTGTSTVRKKREEDKFLTHGYAAFGLLTKILPSQNSTSF